MSEIIIVTETNYDVIVSGVVNQNITSSQVVQTVDVQTSGTQGPQGPAGATGPTGPQGPPGPAGGVTSVNGKTGAVDIFLSDIEQSGATSGQLVEWNATATQWQAANPALFKLPSNALAVQIPDSTVTGGNARGAGAVDFQRTRSAAAQVASGSNTFVAAGSNNEVAANNSATLGSNNIVLGLANFVAGESNTVDGQNIYAVGISNSITDGLGINTFSTRVNTLLLGSGNSIDQNGAGIIINNSLIGAGNACQDTVNSTVIIGSNNVTGTSSIQNVIIGGDNQATDGSFNTIIGQQHAVSTGSGNTILGSSNNIPGDTNTIIGFSNTGTGALESLIIGQGNSINVGITSSAVVFGNTNTVSQPTTFTLGNSHTVTGTGTQSVVVGYQGNSRGLSGAIVFSTGRRSENGDSQGVKMFLRRTTTNNTPAFLVSSGTGTPTAQTVFTPATRTTNAINLKVLARRNTSTAFESAYWNYTILFKVGASASTAAIVHSQLISSFQETSLVPTVVTLVADTTLGALNIQVTGIAATVDWVAELNATQIRRLI